MKNDEIYQRNLAELNEEYLEKFTRLTEEKERQMKELIVELKGGVEEETD